MGAKNSDRFGLPQGLLVEFVAAIDLAHFLRDFVDRLDAHELPEKHERVERRSVDAGLVVEERVRQNVEQRNERIMFVVYSFLRHLCPP